MQIQCPGSNMTGLHHRAQREYLVSVEKWGHGRETSCLRTGENYFIVLAIQVRVPFDVVRSLRSTNDDERRRSKFLSARSLVILIFFLLIDELSSARHSTCATLLPAPCPPHPSPTLYQDGPSSVRSCYRTQIRPSEQHSCFEHLDRAELQHR